MQSEHGDAHAIDKCAGRQIIYAKSRHGPLWAKVAFMQEVGVRPNCKAGSLSYSSTDYCSTVMLIGRSVLRRLGPYTGSHHSGCRTA